MNYLNEIPDHLAQKITECEDLSELKSMRLKYRGVNNVFVRLAIDERAKNIKHRSIGS
ncbi:MAG: hypothetical protein AB3N16_15130 [Flavobacteriaceae bacterium]